MTSRCDRFSGPGRPSPRFRRKDQPTRHELRVAQASPPMSVKSSPQVLDSPADHVSLGLGAAMSSTPRCGIHNSRGPGGTALELPESEDRRLACGCTVPVPIQVLMSVISRCERESPVPLIQRSQSVASLRLTGRTFQATPVVKFVELRTDATGRSSHRFLERLTTTPNWCSSSTPPPELSTGSAAWIGVTQ